MNAKRKHQQGLRPNSRNPRSASGWQEFFHLARTMRVRDDFLAERGDTPPQERWLFARHANHCEDRDPLNLRERRRSIARGTLDATHKKNPAQPKSHSGKSLRRSLKLMPLWFCE